MPNRHASRALAVIVALGGGFVACAGASPVCPATSAATTKGSTSSATISALPPKRLLVVDRGLVCYGDAAHRLFCNENEKEPSSFHEVVPLRGAVELALDRDGACARMDDRTVLCWGANLRGEIGDGSKLDPVSYGAHCAPPASAAPSAVVAVTVGAASSSKPKASASASWKSKIIGGPIVIVVPPAASTSASAVPTPIHSGWQRPLLAPSMTPPRLPPNGLVAPVVVDPTPVVGIDDAVQLANAGGARCVLTKGGATKCWGYGIGVEPNGMCSASSIPITIGDGDVRALGSGGGDSILCALDGDGRIRCWGTRSSKSPYPRFEWSVRDDAGDVVEIASGFGPLCARREGGAVTCWGANWHDVLDPDVDPWSSAAVTPLELRGALGIALGAQHGCAILGDDLGVTCWGSTAAAATGIGVVGDAWNVPLPVRDLRDVVQIAAGNESTCALRADRTLWCWGWGFGADRRPSLVPVKVATLPD